LLFSIFQTKSFIESNRYNIDKEVNKSFNFIYLLLVGSSILFLFYLHDIKINDRYLSFLITGLSISIICTITCLEYALKWITGSKNSNPRCFIDLIYFTRPSTKKNLIRSYIYKSPVLEWYLRVKLKMENDYEPFIELCHSKKTITDIGCGYGFLSHMLYYTDKDRKITGIDYDEEKISTAKGVLKNESVQFISGDAEEVVFQNSDIFIINDVLHYMTFDKQERIIEKCMQSLNGGGKIIIREGNSESKKHAGTKFTEVWSTKILKFNKTENELYFTSRSRMEAIAKRHNYLVEVIDNTKFTSNEIFVFKKTNKTE
jgi:2-polyprenyl-3-methyl-5-hydroxy-6-metoxy-1,4-benzoquinol methylase